jgi:hypothetical protein
MQHVPDAVSLYHQNHNVDDYNRKEIVDPIECFADDTIVGYINVSELADVRRRLHRKSVVEYSGLSYKISFGVGYPHMITTNIDVEDGMVNGAIGVLKYIETIECENNQLVAVASASAAADLPRMSPLNTRLWLDYSNLQIGQKCRIKCRPHVLSKRDMLNARWTPVSRRLANIALTKTVKCKRNQFAVVPACAITIHKSQGGTVDHVVYKYDTKQQDQLVCVALSRVTTLEGLY